MHNIALNISQMGRGQQVDTKMQSRIDNMALFHYAKMWFITGENESNFI